MVRVTLIVWGRREVRSVSHFRSFFFLKIVMKETEIIHSQIPQNSIFGPLVPSKNPCLVVLMLSYCISHGEMFFYSIIVSLALIPCFLFSRCPLFQSFSPPTATFTFRKKNSSNQVTSFSLTLVVVVGNVWVKVCFFGSTCTGTIRLKILPKIETKGMTPDDVTSLCEKSFLLMRSAFLDISVTRSNGPLSHWTFTTRQHPHFLSQASPFSHRNNATPVEFCPQRTAGPDPAAAPAPTLLCALWAEWRTAKWTVWICCSSLHCMTWVSSSHPVVPFLLPYFDPFPLFPVLMLPLFQFSMSSFASSPPHKHLLDCVEVKYYCSVKKNT